MAVSTTWIKNNMFGPSNQQERRLTETELKFQRSLQRLSIPDWYLNRRSNPPKILRNVNPIESQPPYRRSSTNKKNCDLDTTSSIRNSSSTQDDSTSVTKNTCDSGTYKVSRSTKPQESSPRKSTDNETKLFDTSIPKVKLSKNISKTFPKMSPVRKIQNINIVFPPGTKINISPALEEVKIPGISKYTTFVVRKGTRNNEENPEDNNETSQESPKRENYRNIENLSELLEDTFGTPRVKTNFQIRAVSTPKCSTHNNLLSSTIMEESSNTWKKSSNLCSSTIIEGGSDTWKKSPNLYSSTIIEETVPTKSVTSNFFEKTLLEDMEKTKKLLFRTFEVVPSTPKETMSRESQRTTKNVFDARIRSLEPILFERDETALLSSVSSDSIRAIAATSDEDDEERECNSLSSDVSYSSKTSTISKKIDDETTSNEDHEERKSISPHIDFFYSSKKTTVLKNIEYEETKTNNENLGERKCASPCTTFFYSSKKFTVFKNIDYETVNENDEDVGEKKCTLPCTDSSYTNKKITMLKNVENDTTSTKKVGDHDERKCTSPCTGFLYSSKKSTALENIVKSAQESDKKSLVRGIINELNGKLRSASPKPLKSRPKNVNTNGQNFVRNFVRALENGDKIEMEEILGNRRKCFEEDDTANSSESETKSAVSSTSISLKDIDSGSDSDQRSPSYKGDDEMRFIYETFDKKSQKQEKNEEDDSVYWIPVSRCKLPRTSSLLSMMSKLSTNERQSPCFSPIRSDSENSDHSQNVAWGVPFKRIDVLSRQLFRIDETDSGYSDRSSRSERYAGTFNTETSILDTTWSENTQNELEARCVPQAFIY